MQNEPVLRLQSGVTWDWSDGIQACEWLSHTQHSTAPNSSGGAKTNQPSLQTHSALGLGASELRAISFL